MTDNIVEPDDHASVVPSQPPEQQQKKKKEVSARSSLSSSASSVVYEEQIIVESLSQGIFGQTPGVKNELGQEADEILRSHLSMRHVVTISLSGVVGSGLFLGTAESLSLGGPLGMILGYCIVSTICYAVMQCLGEMICYLPLPGGIIQLSERFVGPSMSFALGWTICYNWLLTSPAEISAATILIGYWDQTTHPAVYISVGIVIITAINLLGAKWYGETEFWFASIKILCLFALLLLSILIVAGVGAEGVIGLKYWRSPYVLIHQHPLDAKQGTLIPGPQGRFLAWWSVLLRASYSFHGCEIVGNLAGETRDPRRVLPICVRSIWLRVVVLYLLGTVAISFICPGNDVALIKEEQTAVRSPFVIAIHHAGIRILPSIINAVLVTSTLSAGSSNLYTSSRALYALSLTRRAPRIFRKTSKHGMPLPAILVGVLFSSLAFLCLSESTNQVFEYFLNITSVAGMAIWACICFTYLRFRKGFRHQKLARSALPYRGWGQPFLAYYALFWCILIIIFNGWSNFLPDRWHWATFVSSYLGIPLFLGALLIGRYLSGQGLVRCCVMDFTSGLSLLAEHDTQQTEQRQWWKKALQSLVA